MTHFTPAILGLLVGGSLLLSAPVPVRPVRIDEQLLAEVNVPPPGFASATNRGLSIEIRRTNLTVYSDRGVAQSKLRDAVRSAQSLLWATSPVTAPPALAAAVRSHRGKVPRPVLDRIAWEIPTTEQGITSLKESAYQSQRDIARAMNSLEMQLERLEEVESFRLRECKRWRANYDLMRAWVMLRLLYLEETSAALGMLRRELPPYTAKKHRTWQLQIREIVRDTRARNKIPPVEKLLEQIMKEYPDTVWADLAASHRYRLRGIEWVAVP